MLIAVTGRRIELFRVCQCFVPGDVFMPEIHGTTIQILAVYRFPKAFDVPLCVRHQGLDGMGRLV